MITEVKNPFWSFVLKQWDTITITKIGVLASMIFVLGITVQVWFAGRVVFQLADAFSFILIIIYPWFIALPAFWIGLFLINLLVGAFFYIPITLIICFCMFLVIKIGCYLQTKMHSCFLVASLLIASSFILLNVLYTWLLYGPVLATLEVFVDTSQASTTFISAVILYAFIYKINKRSLILRSYR